jgi:hypothetical protein
VGWKTTVTVQLDPAARVERQSFAPPPWLVKSPVVEMREILRVDFPVFFRVTVLAAPVAPTATLAHEREVGVAVAVVAPAATVRFTVTVWVILPDLPVTIIVAVPIAAFAAAVSVNALVDVVEAGLNAAVTLAGIPVAVSLTVPVKPAVGFTVITLCTELPGATVKVPGFAVRLNVAVDATVRLRVVLAVKLPEIPEIVTVEVPSVAVAVAVKVKVLVDEVGFGLNPAVTPLGKLDALNVGLPLNPLRGTTVTVVVF